jgi:pimeloyl-ACP methyl ester carboxylesterase
MFLSSIFRVELYTPFLFLLMGADSDLVIPEVREGMMETVPDIEVHVVTGTGHMIPQDVQEKYEELIRWFLDKIY